MARGTAPDWPAMMQRATAARYCDMTASEFEGEVVSGRLPLPVQLGHGEKWQRRALDEAIDRLAGAAVPDWRAGSRLYEEN
jgi:hypothetical protein